ASIDASDISAQAVSVARENAALNGVKINFIESDLFENNLLLNSSYDIIVSNPPYVATSQIKDLQPEVGFEPVIALDGGRDGLDFYRRIIRDAAYYLKNKGYLILEIGFGQISALEGMFESSKLFKIIRVVKDYNSIERVVVARKVDING
ncbi:MAG: peptide chain release factor N(5)-glutamine methyltransferase, partial [Candidatus Omnitrophica bacterium]|nr:peptide chain release factor N(5)-glutamine methyltransferase [Candidatus Omnitrophota bacterium]